MKKILVTGASGTVGLQVIRFLLSEGKYEITALELKNKRAYKRLKAFRKRINIVYGDIGDEAIVDSLIKNHDVVIHLAGVLPPFANVRDDLCKEIDYNGTVTIVNAIKNYNPKCYMLFASSTSVYGKHPKKDKITVETECIIDEYDYYSKYKYECEKYIENNIKNYTIFRLAYVLGDPGKESLIYNVDPNLLIETISSEDAGYAFVSALDNKEKLNTKTFNVTGGEKFRTIYKDYLITIFKSFGLSVRFLSTFLMAEKNYNGACYDDGDDLEDILHFRSKNLDIYYSVLQKYNGIGRFLPRIFALPFVHYYSKKKKKKTKNKD